MTMNLPLLFPLTECHHLAPAASCSARRKIKRMNGEKLVYPVSSWKDCAASNSSFASSYSGSLKCFCKLGSSRYLCSSNKTSSPGNIKDDEEDGVPYEEAEYSNSGSPDSGDLLCENGITIEVIKLERRSRRIESSVEIDASLQTVWELLTDYERLADFIPGLVVSQLIEKAENYARLFQIGQQNLGLGLKFNAKGIIDCYEKDLKTLSFGRRREIDFKMVEGDFLTFEGKWSIEQHDAHDEQEATDSSKRQRFHTILYHVVNVEPKRWLPVRLVEGRLLKEIRTNLSCVREEAHRLTRQGQTLPSS
ncbi:hypothetical protein Dimus_028608 [Dionaea muscipula]